MKKIVQKFGGTSLDTEKKREMAVKHIKNAIESDFIPVIVVSAMGRAGKPYATDTLIKLAEGVHFEIHPREKDLLMSCGEIISAVIMVQTMQKDGIEAVALTGAQAGIYTDKNFGESEIKKVNPERILEIINEEKIPVIAGFQGVTHDGEITTLGRGGSDTTASVIAAAIDALYIEIYTDVAGVMTADPRLVNNARIIDQVSYNEVCELAYQGARVIHPRAAEIAMKEGIPIKVRSTLEENSGTLIHNQGLRGIKGDRPVTGVTSRHNIVFIKIKPNKPAEYATGLIVFNILANHGISVDFINIRPDAISFIVENRNQDKVVNLLADYEFNFEIKKDLIKVSVVGGGMTGLPGVMARLVEALNNKQIDIYQTTDSHTTISCLIKRDEEKEALNALHDAFRLDN
ncbi:MAG: aspartate kinase [Halanaerobiaceae bacterium]